MDHGGPALIVDEEPESGGVAREGECPGGAWPAGSDPEPCLPGGSSNQEVGRGRDGLDERPTLVSDER